MSRTAPRLLRRQRKWIRERSYSPLILPFSLPRSSGHGFRETAAMSKALDSPPGPGRATIKRTGKVAEQRRKENRVNGKSKRRSRLVLYIYYTYRCCNSPFPLGPTSRLYHTASKHSAGPPGGWPFYLLPSFPRWAASTHNLLPFHVWSAGEEDKGLVQVKINEVVYMAYGHQESAVSFFSPPLFFFFS